MATAILLNGASSSGKTSLARAMQAEAQDLLLHISLDDFIGMLPAGVENADQWFPVTRLGKEPNPLVRIDTGSCGAKLLASMRNLARELADDGFPLVIDDVCTVKEVEEWRQAMDGHPFLVVKVDAPIDILIQRENARGDRTLGIAREQAQRIHEGIDYDLTIDTSARSLEDCARMVIDASKLEGGK